MSDFVDMFLNTPYVPPARKPAAPKTPRKKRNAHPEDDLQKAIVKFLRASLPRPSWYCSVPNGAVLKGTKHQRMMQMERLKAAGLRNGAPDLLVFWNGRAFGIEVKAGSSQAESQKEAQRDLEAAGIPYTIAKSIFDVELFLRKHGVPLRASVVTS